MWMPLIIRYEHPAEFKTLWGVSADLREWYCSRFCPGTRPGRVNASSLISATHLHTYTPSWTSVLSFDSCCQWLLQAKSRRLFLFSPSYAKLWHKKIMGKKLILAQTFNSVFSYSLIFPLPLPNIAVSKFFRSRQAGRSPVMQRQHSKPMSEYTCFLPSP